MIEIESKHIPPKGFRAISLFGVCVHRADAREMTAEDYRHESIHNAQFIEVTMCSLVIALVGAIIIPSWWWLLSVPMYYVLYGAFYIVEMIRNRTFDNDTNYRSNPFEAEAYANERDCEYLARRIPFAFIRYFNHNV